MNVESGLRAGDGRATGSGAGVGRAAGRGPEGGFTLVEILIVIGIIAILAGMITVGLQIARVKADEALTKTTIADLNSALERYVQDEGIYPGMELAPDAERNDFPLLFEALFGRPVPQGKGGRSAPYVRLKEENVRVWDDDLQEYRPPERSELWDTGVEKYLIDPWGEPLVYRANKGKDIAKYSFMKCIDADIYSLGPDGEDQTMLGEDVEGEVDDIGNW
jgi:prepilin-type N-terminal cleavage/methylation domain-containing protein